MNIYERYVAKKNEIDRAKRELEQLQAELYTRHIDSIKSKSEDGGTISLNEMGHKFTCVIKFAYKIEDEEKAKIYLSKGCKAFKNKLEFNKTEFKKLDIDEQEEILSMMSVKQSKPTFKVEKKDEE